MEDRKEVGFLFSSFSVFCVCIYLFIIYYFFVAELCTCLFAKKDDGEH